MRFGIGTFSPIAGRCLLLSALVLAAPALAQSVEGGSTYKEHCASCHGLDAAAFAARSLRRADDKVVVQKAGVPVEEFLAKHGAAHAGERDELARWLAGLISAPSAR